MIPFPDSANKSIALFPLQIPAESRKIRNPDATNLNTKGRINFMAFDLSSSAPRSKKT